MQRSSSLTRSSVTYENIGIASFQENSIDNIDAETTENVVEDGNSVRDGGCRAWLVCMATIYTFGLYLGFEFNYGFIYTQFIKEYSQTRNHVIYAGKYAKRALCHLV
jgi:hypothetical protein